MLRLCNGYACRAVGAGGFVAFALQILHGQGMELADELLGKGRTRSHGHLYMHHGLFNVGNFTQGICTGPLARHRALHIVGQGGVVAFNAGRAQAFQNMENVLELEKHRCGGRPSQLQAPQMLQLRQHIDQRRIEGGVDQLQIKMCESGHGKVEYQKPTS